MSPIALICPQCGAPLPDLTARHGSATCEYCGAAVALRGAHVEVSARGTIGQDLERATRRRNAFFEAMKAASLAGSDPYRVLCDAAREHLGAPGESDTVARVTLALASDFEAETGAAVMRDPIVLSRLAEAYLKAIAELAGHTRTTMSLPFLAATPGGPVHLHREVTAADLVALASREPGTSGKRGAPVPSEPVDRPAQEPEKKWWWPF